VKSFTYKSELRIRDPGRQKIALKKEESEAVSSFNMLDVLVGGLEASLVD
jgi:hypothetical protein